MLDIIICLLVFLMAKGLLNISIWVIFWLLIIENTLRIILKAIEEFEK